MPNYFDAYGENTDWLNTKKLRSPVANGLMALNSSTVPIVPAPQDQRIGAVKSAGLPIGAVANTAPRSRVVQDMRVDAVSPVPSPSLQTAASMTPALPASVAPKTQNPLVKANIPPAVPKAVRPSGLPKITTWEQYDQYYASEPAPKKPGKWEASGRRHLNWFNDNLAGSTGKSGTYDPKTGLTWMVDGPHSAWVDMDVAKEHAALEKHLYETRMALPEDDRHKTRVYGYDPWRPQDGFTNAPIDMRLVKKHTKYLANKGGGKDGYHLGPRNYINKKINPNTVQWLNHDGSYTPYTEEDASRVLYDPSWEAQVKYDKHGETVDVVYKDQDYQTKNNQSRNRYSEPTPEPTAENMAAMNDAIYRRRDRDIEFLSDPVNRARAQQQLQDFALPKATQEATLQAEMNAYLARYGSVRPISQGDGYDRPVPPGYVGGSGVNPDGSYFWGRSDIRLKSNIVRVGTHRFGIGIYDYDIDGRRERGVIAQELLTVLPEAVAVGDDGFYRVNYGML